MSNYSLPGYDNWLQGPTRCTDCGAKYYQADGGCTDCAEDFERWEEELDELSTDEDIAKRLQDGTFEGKVSEWAFPDARVFFEEGLSPQEVLDGEIPQPSGWVANG